MNKLEELRRKRQKAEDKYKSFLENFDGIAFKRFEDLTTDFFTGNVESITGYTEEDFLSGKIRFKQLILPGDIDAYKEEFTEFMSSSRKNSERRFRISDKYGDIHYVRERVRKKFNKETQKKYVYGTIQDITRYAEIKQELEKYQHHLQRLVDKKIKDLKIKNQALDASLNAIAITDMEGNITHINSAFLRLWGYESKDEVIGRSGTEFWGDEAKAITGFKKILRSGDFKGELLAVRENGTKMFLDTKANLIKDENNKPIGIVGTFTDVTKHLKTEQKLKKNKQILQKKLNQILSPDYEVCEEDFGNIVDIEQLQNIMDDFYKLTNIGVAIENIKGDVLVATGWQDICTEFHRVHPETRKKCIESDIYYLKTPSPGNIWLINVKIICGILPPLL